MSSVNNRVFYACHAVGFAPHGTTASASYKPASGVQSVGLNTSFNLEEVFQLGQLEIYENSENIPDVEVTIEKVLDGAPLLQHLATPTATTNSLVGRFNNQRCMCSIAFYDDDNTNASGTPLAQVTMSGLYVSSAQVTVNIDGPGTESVTLVGNDKTWATGSAIADGQLSSFIPTTYTDGGTPPAASGITRRQHVEMSGCIWPTEIPGMVTHTVYGAGKGENVDLGGRYAVHMQSITISFDLGRTELFELGRRGPYHRFADFPTEVTCAIEITETEFGDFINAEGTANNNVTNQEIYVLLTDGTRFNLGTSNKLASITSTGGDTGGGNRTTTYNYSNFNSYRATHPLDPAGL